MLGKPGQRCWFRAKSGPWGALGSDPSAASASTATGAALSSRAVQRQGCSPGAAVRALVALAAAVERAAAD